VLGAGHAILETDNQGIIGRYRLTDHAMERAEQMKGDWACHGSVKIASSGTSKLQHP
jgi:hypothetical protein